MKQIDAACRRILEAKYKLGLFKDPFKYCNEERTAGKYSPPNTGKPHAGSPPKVSCC